MEKSINLENSFGEIVERIKSLKELKKDSDVAQLLGLKPKAFWARKKNNSIPEAKMELFAITEGISLGWLLTGKGEIHPAPTLAADVPPTESPPPDNQVYDLDQLLELTHRVMTSGNKEAAAALAKNIEYFAKAVEQDKQITEQSKRIDELEREMQDVRQELNALKDSGAPVPRKLSA